MENILRKRKRSDEILSPPVKSSQYKVFVNQKLVDSQDQEQMRQIYVKTFDLLFKGAKLTRNLENNNDDLAELSKKEILSQIKLSANGKIKYNTKPKQNGLPELRKLSKCCNNLAFFIDASCINCNLNLCEFCGISCAGTCCNKFLCSACITLFGCGSTDEPLCQNCQLLQ